MSQYWNGKVLTALLGLAAVCLAPLQAAFCQETEPYISAGRLDTKTLRLTNLPAAPQLTLHVKGNFGAIYITYTAPGASLGMTQAYYGYHAAGEHVFQQGAFFDFAQAGTYTLSSIELCTLKARCATYTGDTLTAIIPENTFQLVNPHTDVTGPTATSGTIVTTTIRAKNDELVRTQMTVQDNFAGVVSVALVFGVGKARIYLPTVMTDHPIKAAETIDVGGLCSCRRLPAGTYSVTQITLADRAGNYTFISDAATISSIFGNQTITVTD